MQIFPEFSPETVQHEFGSGFTSGIFYNESWIEVNVFSLLVTSDVIRLLFSSGHVAGVRETYTRGSTGSLKRLLNSAPLLPVTLC